MKKLRPVVFLKDLLKLVTTRNNIRFYEVSMKKLRSVVFLKDLLKRVTTRNNTRNFKWFYYDYI